MARIGLGLSKQFSPWAFTTFLAFLYLKMTGISTIQMWAYIAIIAHIKRTMENFSFPKLKCQQEEFALKADFYRKHDFFVFLMPMVWYINNFKSK